MKLLNFHNLLLASLLGLSTFFAGSYPLVKAQSEPKLGCQATIDLVRSELSKKGFFVPVKNPPPGADGRPKVKIDKSTIRENWYDYPAERTEAVIFVLGEAVNLWSSPKYMATLASKIMTKCNNVGFVEFADWWEGSAIIGYFPDNTVRHFIWPPSDSFTRTVKTLQGDRTLYKWGYYESP
jgi:hypothetical protein